jgi:deoxyribonuclease-4
MYLGAHVSIAGSFAKCIDRAAALGANTFMTFASSPRSLQTQLFPKTEIDLYLKKKSEFRLGPHFFHGVYLVNLATENPDYLVASCNSLIFYQQLAGRINAVGTIFHIGSHKGRGFSATVNQIIDSVNQVIAASPAGTKLILENAAGQANTVGQTFEELAQIITGIKDKSKIAVCLDTQHAFAAGYRPEEVLDAFDRIIGLPYLSVIHFNDSQTDFNSHVDRHDNIGSGKIGIKNMAKILNDPRVKQIPFILETPGENHSGPRKQDVDLLKQLAASAWAKHRKLPFGK